MSFARGEGNFLKAFSDALFTVFTHITNFLNIFTIYLLKSKMHIKFLV